MVNMFQHFGLRREVGLRGEGMLGNFQLHSREQNLKQRIREKQSPSVNPITHVCGLLGRVEIPPLSGQPIDLLLIVGHLVDEVRH